MVNKEGGGGGTASSKFMDYGIEHGKGSRKGPGVGRC